jgi:hypothetical protein
MRRRASLSRGAAKLTALLAALALAGCGDDSGQKATSADAFVDSIGVNIHMSYNDTVYGDRRAIVDALRELGARHVRDGIVIDRVDQYSALRDIANHGIGVDLILGDPLGRFGTGNFDDQMGVLRQDMAGVAESVEGPNEFDTSGATDWPGTLGNYQKQLYDRVKRDPALSDLPVIGPSLVSLNNWAQLGDIGQDFDSGNLHPYPGGGPPTSGLLQSQVATVRPIFGSKPIVATETGYHNSLTPPPGQQPGVSEAAAAIYVPRLFLEHFKFGIARTYLYELADEKPDPAGRDPEQHFGLIRTDFSQKPAFTALRNTIALLVDPGPSFDPGRLEYTLKAKQPVSRLLMQKRDGRFYLALWRSETAAFNTGLKEDVSPPAIGVDVAFPNDPARVREYAPVRSPQPVRSWDGDTDVTLSLASEPVILEIDP